MFAIAIGASSIVLLVVSLGLSFSVSLTLSGAALCDRARGSGCDRRGAAGRETQARAAVTVAWIGLGAVACVAGDLVRSSLIAPAAWRRAFRSDLQRRRSEPAHARVASA